MRNWHFLIPIIAVAVWILSSLIRGAEEQRVRRPRPQADPDEPPPDRPRRSASEIDRFLQEVQRRRRDTGDRRAEPERRAEPTVFDVPEAIPVESVPVPPPPPPAPRRPRTPRRQVEVAVPVAQMVVPAVPAPPAPAWQPPPPPPAAPAAVGTAPVRTPLMKQLHALLRSPQSLGVAFVLREVLDRPVSQRRGSV